MRSGKLRHRLTIEKPTHTEGERGERVTTWTPVVEVWADLAPASTKERQAADQIVEELTHTARMRFLPGVTITGEHRATYRGRVFEFVGPPRNVGERDRELILDLKEHPPADAGQEAA